MLLEATTRSGVEGVWYWVPLGGLGFQGLGLFRLSDVGLTLGARCQLCHITFPLIDYTGVYRLGNGCKTNSSSS